MKNIGRNRIIDLYKTIAILGVVFFHMGVLPNGYLGVDVFFVISGYFFAYSNHEVFSNKTFSLSLYIKKKIKQFAPMMIVVGTFSLIAGAFVMLPDDYENLVESIVANSFFSNNILLAITTKDYWNIANVYKPLMHMWYIGCLVQCLFVLSVIVVLTQKLFKKNLSKWVFLIVFLISFGAYIFLNCSDGAKFYFPLFRLFEISVGSLIVYFPKFKWKSNCFQYIVLILLSIVLGQDYIEKNVLLIFVCLLTCFGIWTSTIEKESKLLQFLSIPGKYSFYIFSWHQIFIAFLLYSIFETQSLRFCACVVGLTIIFSIISAWAGEKCTLFSKKSVFALMGSWVLLLSFAICIYLRAGVIRDVPELGISKANATRGMHAQYVDIPYSWDNDFVSDKIKVLIIGDSYGRDFANILNESEWSSKLEISYFFSGDDIQKIINRIEECDLFFYASISGEMPEEVFNMINKKDYYLVGTKSFGKSNGIVYFRKGKEDYLTTRVDIEEAVLKKNSEQKSLYGDRYIDMITPLLEKEGIRVFDDEGHFISHDCLHLTKYGAMYYSKVLNLDAIMKKYNYYEKSNIE